MRLIEVDKFIDDFPIRLNHYEYWEKENETQEER